MRLLFFILIFTFLCGFAFAQENNPRPSKDKAFILEETSPEQAIEALGKPQSDKMEKLDVIYVDEWIAENFKKEKYRVLSFEKFEDLGKVKLTFFGDKLVAIKFSIEKDIPAARLSAIYKVQFIPILNKFGIKENVGEFDKQTRDVLVADFPRIFYLVGTTKTSVLSARVFNGEVPDADPIRKRPKFSDSNNIRTNPITGKVTDLQILSRTLLK